VYTDVAEGGYIRGSISYVDNNDSVFHGCLKTEYKNYRYQCIEYGDVRTLAAGTSVRVGSGDDYTTWTHKGGGIMTIASKTTTVVETPGQDIVFGKIPTTSKTSSTTYVPIGGVTSYMSTRYLIRAKP